MATVAPASYAPLATASSPKRSFFMNHYAGTTLSTFPYYAGMPFVKGHARHLITKYTPTYADMSDLTLPNTFSTNDLDDFAVNRLTSGTVTSDASIATAPILGASEALRP